MRDGSVAAGSAAIVVKAWAIVAVGSLNATPTRFEPGSMARIRKLRWIVSPWMAA
jgi:hypothetical protein